MDVCGGSAVWMCVVGFCVGSAVLMCVVGFCVGSAVLMCVGGKCCVDVRVSSVVWMCGVGVVCRCVCSDSNHSFAIVSQRKRELVTLFQIYRLAF